MDFLTPYCVQFQSVKAPDSWAYSGIGRSCIGIWCSFVVKQENQVSQVVLSLLSCHFIPYTSLGQPSDAKLIKFCNYASLCWQGVFINSLMEICTKWVDQFVEIKTCRHCYLCQRWKSCAVAKCLINKAFLQIATGQSINQMSSREIKMSAAKVTLLARTSLHHTHCHKAN